MSLSTPVSGGASFDTVADRDSLRLVRLSAAHARFSEEIARLEHGERLKTLIDELNAVYVALTRSRDELYAFVPQKASSSRNAVRYLIPAEVDRGAAGTGPPRATDGSRIARMPVPVAVYRDWVSQVAHEFRDDAGAETRESRSRGDTLHYMLAQIGNLDREPAAAVFERAAAAAAARYPHRTDIAELMAVVRRLVASAGTRPLFHAGAAAVSTEQEVVDARGATYRIDRLVINDTRALVVDYKTSRSHTAAHQAQVRAYMQLVAELYPAAAVTGIVVYLDECAYDEVAP
jgi:ATP-dependent exoDNAse (exonuclease V) beta subunit